MINIIKLTGTVATLSRIWYPTLVPYEIKYNNFENSHWLLTLAIVRMQFLQVFKCNTVAKMCQYELMIKSISGILLYCNTLYVHLYTLKNIYLSLFNKGLFGIHIHSGHSKGNRCFLQMYMEHPQDKTAKGCTNAKGNS